MLLLEPTVCIDMLFLNYRNEYELLVADRKGVCLVYDIRKTGDRIIMGTLGEQAMVSSYKYRGFGTCETSYTPYIL